MNTAISRQLSLVRLACTLIGALLLIGPAVFAQTTKFTHQVRLIDTNSVPDGIYEMQFKLFDDVVNGNPVGATLTLDGFGSNPPAVTVAGGVFTVQLDFGADAFNGADRYVEVAIKYPGEPTFTTIRPRQQITSKPYAIRSLSAAIADNAAAAEIAVNAKQLDGVAASKYVQTSDVRLSDSRLPMADSPYYIQNTSIPQSSSNFNIDGDGTVGGTLSGHVVNATDQYNLGGLPMLRAPLGNLFVGWGAGQSSSPDINSGAILNSFFGLNAGYRNTSGGLNSFFGGSAGFANTYGHLNSFFGVEAGASNTEGNRNSFFGDVAGCANTAGGENSFFGVSTGLHNITGSHNTLIGSSADVYTDGLQYATAIGAGAVVRESDTIVLGKAAQTDPGGRPADTVRVPGTLVVDGTLSGNTVNALTQYSIGDIPVLKAPGTNLFAGIGAGQNNGQGVPMFGLQPNHNSFFGMQAGFSNTAGFHNSFFGASAGFTNTSGGLNSFFGMEAGFRNTEGGSNSFFGNGAGAYNLTGGLNSFFGTLTGRHNIAGTNNTLIGSNADVETDGLQYATAIGADAVVSASDTIVLGKAARTYVNGRRPADTVRVPGDLIVSGSLTASLPPGSNNYIQNSTGKQVSADFNIDGDGTAGGTLSGNKVNATTQYNLAGQLVLSAAGNNVVLGRKPDTVQVAGNFESKGTITVTKLGSDGSTALCLNAKNEIASCSSSVNSTTTVTPSLSDPKPASQIRPISFEWKEDGLGNAGLTTAFINAFKEQQGQIEEQREQIRRQQSQIEALRKLVCRDHLNANVCK